MRNDGTGMLSVDVANVGKCSGTETVQLYIRNLQDKEGPLKSLRAFQRVTLKTGETKTVSLQLDKKSFEFWDSETNTMRTKSGNYEILVGNSSKDKDLKTINITL